MYFIDGTTVNSLSRPGWNFVDVLREVATFSVVLVVVAAILIFLPHRAQTTSHSLCASPGLSGLSAVSIDDLGPWVERDGTKTRFFNSDRLQSDFTAQVAQRLQSRGVSLSHEATAPKLKLLMSYVDQEYAIRGPRIMKALELDLLEDASLKRKSQFRMPVATWSEVEEGDGCSTANLEVKSTKLIDSFLDQLKVSNQSK